MALHRILVWKLAYFRREDTVSSDFVGVDLESDDDSGGLQHKITNKIGLCNGQHCYEPHGTRQAPLIIIMEIILICTSARLGN